MEAKLDPRLRARRVALCIVLISFFSVLAGLPFVFLKCVGGWKQMAIRVLPPATEAVWYVVQVVDTPIGYLLLASLAAAGVTLVVRGRFDRRLGGLTLVAALVTLGLMALVLIAISLPALRSGGQLFSW